MDVRVGLVWSVVLVAVPKKYQWLMKMKKPRHQWWREAYRSNRYLQGKSDTHVVARIRYLHETMMTLSPTGQIGFQEIGTLGLGEYLMVRYTHTLEEIELRHMQLPDGFLAGAHLPRITYPNTPPELLCYEKRKRKEPGQLFKYGKEKYLKSSLKEGLFRFAGARSYKDPSLNPAIHDDELALTIYPTRAPMNSILGIPSLASDGGLTLTHFTDYYIQCFSHCYSLRMFEDFSADSCLVIYDAKEFGRRILSKLEECFPDWVVGSIPVTYIDPDEPGDKPLPIPAAKHMKYAYQLEERIICHPKTQMLERLSPFMLTIGQIDDIAELVTFNMLD